MSQDKTQHELPHNLGLGHIHNIPMRVPTHLTGASNRLGVGLTRPGIDSRPPFTKIEERYGKTMEADEIVTGCINRAHNKVQPGAAMNPALIIALVLKFFEVLQECPLRNAARRNLRRGSLFVQGAAINAMQSVGYSNDRDTVTAAAEAFTSEIAALPAADIERLLNAKEELPPKTPVSAFWPMAIAMVATLLFIPGDAKAFWPSVEQGQEQEQAAEFWPVSIALAHAPAQAWPAPEPRETVTEERERLIDDLTRKPYALQRYALEDLSMPELREAYRQRQFMLEDLQRRPAEPPQPQTVQYTPPQPQTVQYTPQVAGSCYGAQAAGSCYGAQAAGGCYGAQQQRQVVRASGRRVLRIFGRCN